MVISIGFGVQNIVATNYPNAAGPLSDIYAKPKLRKEIEDLFGEAFG